MRKILCDRCGAEIPLTSKIGYVAVNWRAPSDESLMYENPYEGYDFCEQCMHDIVEVIDSICAHSEVIEEKKETPEELARKFVEAMKEEYASEPEEPGPYTEEEKEPLAVEGEPETVEAAVEEEPEKPVGRLADNPPPKQFVNLRELRELVKAGKKPKEIAEHFGISLASYYNYRKKAEAMWNAGML